MEPALRISEIRSMIRYWDELSSTDQKVLRSHRRQQQVVVLARGCYILAEHWNELYGEDRQIAVALAHSDRELRRPVFSHFTAAALLGLPLYRFSSIRVHMTNPQGGIQKSTPRVMRHEGTASDDETIEIAGVRVTSMERTVLDLARFASAELALGCADEALKLEALSAGGSAQTSQEIWREGLLEKLHEMPGERGVRRARKVLKFADGRAESALESVGRLRFARAGIRTELQYRVPGTHGYDYFVDFELPDHKAFAEADGEVKYFDKEMARGRDPKQILRDEKEREDWIRGTTKKPIYRFGLKHVATQESFENRFASFGVFGSPMSYSERHRIP
ncbi:hypothetical protein G7067_12065 [Leucobacter insecticola]|uniref:Uncharacterized protein n=1 Tax=Leucobacter insecticola TaxID=2714934 RepID=A0A6G8FKT7_9MICO|nr:hypothetical protein [Leucobacter insecticola]QIM16971.1 hypothetical protein G7067_12065 [Leucobacter insecticola]